MLDRARRIADELLWPAAEQVDSASTVPPSHLQALASAGLMSIAAPGGPAPGAALLLPAVHEILAGGCGATSFVWAQHHSPLRLVAASPNGDLRNDLLAPMRSGALLAGIGFSHLRRRDPSLVAVPVPGCGKGGAAWELSGRVPWLTSWGMADVFVLGARLEDGSIVWVAFRPDGSQRYAARPLPLSVLGATGTVELSLDRWMVSEAEVVSVESADSWRRRDALATAAPSAGALGVVDRCARLLNDGDQAAARAGAALQEQLRRVKASGLALTRRRDRLAMSLQDRYVPGRPHPRLEAGGGPGSGLDGGPGGESGGGDPCEGDLTDARSDESARGEGALDLDHVTDDQSSRHGSEVSDSQRDELDRVLQKLHCVRAKGLLLAQKAATAVVAANGGKAMAAGNPAQRLAREAAFYLVQAQTAEGREATLRAVS